MNFGALYRGLVAMLRRTTGPASARERDRLDTSMEHADTSAHELEKSHRTLAQAPASRAATPAPQPDSRPGGPQHGLRGGAGEPGDAGSGTQAPPGATRYLETSLGVISYAELAPHLARNVLALTDDVVAGVYASRPLDDALLLDLHGRIAGSLVPQFSRRWRKRDVVVGVHEPPSFTQVPVLMREYARDLAARFAALPDEPDETTLEFLAFCEGRLLTIHPFEDFNGRVTRVFVTEILRRLRLPAINPAPAPGPEAARYLQALRTADRGNLKPLMDFWRERLEQEESK
jgi:CRISPR-associated endonuclease/helicase Cas3